MHDYKLLKQNLSIFCTVALLCGWIGLGIDQFIELPDGEDSPGMAIWLISPLLIVLFLRAFRKDGWKDAGFNPFFSNNLRWYFLAFIIFPLITVISVGLSLVLGLADVSSFSLADYAPMFLTLLLFNLGKNIFEESVWRGYLTSKLIALKLSDLKIYLIAGLVWGLWHLPYYMAFLPESDIHAILPVSPFVFALVAILVMLFWSVLFTELFRITKSIWPLVLLHAMEDSVVNHLVIEGHVSFTSAGAWLFSPVSGLFTASCYLIVGLMLRKYRLKKSVQPTP